MKSIILAIGFQLLALCDGVCSRSRPLEIYILQDGTSSFQTYLATATKTLTGVVDDLAAEIPHMRGGVGIFGDKPEFCFAPITRIGPVAEFRHGVQRMHLLTPGGDLPETSLEAMAFAAGSAAGFTIGDPEVIRIMVVITDAPSHHGPEGTFLKVPNPDLANRLDCAADYPPVSQVRKILHEASIFPLVLLANGDNVVDGMTIKAFWDDMIFEQLGYTEHSAQISSISRTGSDIADILRSTVLQFQCTVEEAVPPVKTTTPGCFTATPLTTTTRVTAPCPGTTTACPGVTTVCTGQPRPTTHTLATTLPTSSQPAGAKTAPIAIGAASGAAALLAGGAAIAYFAQGTPPLEFDMEGENMEDEDEGDRELENPTTSVDYGS